MEKTRCPLRLGVILKNYFFVWLNFTAESVNCSLFLKNLEKTFLQFDLQKKTSSNRRPSISRRVTPARKKGGAIKRIKIALNGCV